MGFLGGTAALAGTGDVNGSNNMGQQGTTHGHADVSHDDSCLIMSCAGAVAHDHEAGGYAQGRALDDAA